MPAPLYLANKNATVTIGGVAYPVMDGTIDDSVDRVDLSNTLTGGFQYVTGALRRIAFSGIKVVYDVNIPPTWAVGSFQTIVMAIPSGTSYNGTFLILKKSRTFLDVTGYYTFTFDAENQGVVTITE